MKLSTKIPLLLSAAMMALAVTFALWVHWTAEQTAESAVRATAASQLQVAQRSLGLTGSLPDYAYINAPDVPAPLRDAVSTSREGTYLTSTPPEVWAAVRLDSGDVLAVRLSWADTRSMITDGLDRNLAIGVGLTAVVTAALATVVGLQLRRRLVVAEAVARRVADGELDLRVADVVRGHDEVAQLGHTIDALTASARERIETEKRVSADFAHDIRTPLTSLVTSSQLLGDDAASVLVKGQVTRLWALSEELLEVAALDRAEQRLELDDYATSSLARASVAGVTMPGGTVGAGTAPAASEIVVDVVADAVVATDRRRVQRVLVNLLNNALKHGRPPVRIVVDGASIAVRDAGAGFPAYLVETGPERFRTGASDRGGGHGLGLTIASGQARALGASLTFRNDHGAVATLILPEA